MASAVFPAAAQDLEASLRSRLAQRLQTSASSVPTPIALEGAVDPRDYVVGPGDVFTVSVGGGTPFSVSAVVSADGRLSFAELGAFEVAGASLAAVRDTLEGALAQAYRNVPTTLSLSAPRQFYVHVSGAVAETGRLLVGPVARVSDALSIEGGAGFDLQEVGTDAVVLEEQRLRLERERLAQQQFTDITERERGASSETVAMALPALRNVVVTHADGTRDRVDLQRYFSTGDVRHNPYLRDGDAIHVPLFTVRLEGVFVDGDLIEAKYFDHREGDTVGDLAEVALGPLALSRVRAVRITRLEGGEPTTLNVEGEDLEGVADLSVTPRAQLYFVTQNPEAGLAVAAGAVRYPGAYPIQVGETSVQDLLAAAGGLRPDASPRLAVLERRLVSSAIDDGTEYAFRDAARLSTLDFLTRDYFQRNLDQFQRITLTAEVLQGQGAAPVYLRDGDRLLVPVGTEDVQVLGQVLRPGYVPYVPGEDAAYYLDAAGGTAEGAGEIYVVDSATGEMRPAAGSEILAGDRLFVSRPPQPRTEQQQQIAAQLEQLEQLEQRERNDLVFDVARTVLTAVTATVAVLGLILRN